MSSRRFISLLTRVANTSAVVTSTSRAYNTAGKATLSSLSRSLAHHDPLITSALPAPHHAAKIVFDSSQAADFKYIWLRDNCKCPKCVHEHTNQKVLDTPDIDVNVKPKSLSVNGDGELQVVWDEAGGEHASVYSPKWLYKYGRSFIHNSYETDVDLADPSRRPEIHLWNRADIWKNLPEMAFNEFMETEEGLRKWLEMFYQYGVALLRGVPAEDNKILDVVKRFAYIKETQYGVLFDVINNPTKDAHLAYSGVYLPHHTDMNYREKSPGMQLLHCIKAHHSETGEVKDMMGGKSFFVDGFRAAKWMEENAPAAFHVLTSTPVRFSIKNEGMKYSATFPIICLNQDGDVCEIHVNNRTMAPLQAPTQVITPFYHAYQLFSKKLREDSKAFEFQMVPGDLVAFNNRRVLHGRTAYDPKLVERKLQGCYVDIDETFSKFDQLQSKYIGRAEDNY